MLLGCIWSGLVYSLKALEIYLNKASIEWTWLGLFVEPAFMEFVQPGFRVLLTSTPLHSFSESVKVRTSPPLLSSVQPWSWPPPGPSLQGLTGAHFVFNLLNLTAGSLLVLPVFSSLLLQVFLSQLGLLPDILCPLPKLLGVLQVFWSSLPHTARCWIWQVCLGSLC